MMTDIQHIRIEDFNYPLPDERIAKHPLADRAACKLLVRTAEGEISEHIFAELPALLPADAMLVYNNTRVINARLRFRKGERHDGATIEIFCLEPVEPADYAVSFATTERCSWKCFVGNSKRWKEGPLTMPLQIGDERLTLTAERSGRQGNASVVTFTWDNPRVTLSQIISAAGEIPIPPYLNRDTEATDSTDYQTVYSHIDGSVAAPTAGLHFTDEVLAEISRRGIPRRELTLHVGAGTFQPVKSDEIGEHEMHSEFIAVPVTLIRELAATDRRIIAVGTTSVRTLESLYHAGKLIAAGQWDGEVPQWTPYEDADLEIPVSEALTAVADYAEANGSDTFMAQTRIIIAPGYDYKVVKGMVTNFHQPQSTLLLLVSAFTRGDWRPMYDFALAHGFRFLSYGDASLLL
ncbi:MAG: S-adenosylmethionine:tRNA ribosyltransferase-isomerase [Muribaculaceae bacterium]|nr:S-adenosylmethionine:tRNA ribosyltransferase-isomerase [Muribaculaceae bacterium]